MPYVHLHRHGEFSRLDGLGTAKQYAEKAAELGQSALGLTDHGTMSGALHHIDACNKASIFPITGVEAYFRPDRSSKETRQAWHLCLFAKNLKGWHNLMRIVSASHGEIEHGGGFYQHPCVDPDLLQRHSEGIVCSSACISSYLSQLITWGDSQTVREYIDGMLNIYGDDFWLEIMPHDFQEQRDLNVTLAGIAHERSIPLIATNDTHFPYKEWADTHRVAKIMGVQKTFAKVERDIEEGKADYLGELTPTLYLAHEEEVRMWFQNFHPGLSPHLIDEAVKNTELFVSRLQPFVLDASPKLPHIPDLKKPADETLFQWIQEGLEALKEKYPVSHWDKWSHDDYVDRAEYEFEVLENSGVIDYFVMLGDVVRWAKSQGIRVGLGRGSAAGCLISYLIGITAVDPIPYGLLFERFLNPERKGLPDIDMDFDSERRDEVKEYLVQKYGASHVADITTHQRFQPKKVLQDLCRVYGIPLPETLRYTNVIEIRPDDEETTLEELLPLHDLLGEFKDKYPDIWRHALRLEGMVANAGKHAAGIIVTPKPVAEYMALERGKKGDLVTSWSDAADFAAISDNGFVKYDFLGITGLTKHEYACKLIEKRTGDFPDLLDLPVLFDPDASDPEILKLFAEGFTIGLFQFASRGITNLIREIDPDSILEIAAANALYRPGPMKGGVTWEYAKRKHDPSRREFWADEVRPILEETYGLVAYQEQVMEISKQLGNFSGAQADDLRKAMGKLYRIKGGKAAKEFMGQFEEKFFENATRYVKYAVAETIWKGMLEFGHYGFNRSHSVSYSLLAYQDAYLKVYYPAEFYAAFLTYEDDDEKRKSAMREAKQRSIEIVLPDIERSDVGYSVDEEGRLILGLTSIAGIGEHAAAKIVKERPFSDFNHLLLVSEIPLRPLLESGTIDHLCDRQEMLAEVAKPITDRKRLKLEERGEPLPTWQVFEHHKYNMKLKKPREIEGELTYLTKDQLEAMRYEKLNLPMAALNMTEDEIQWLEEHSFTQEELASLGDGAIAVVGGEITRVTRRKTKRGSPFANVDVIFGQNQHTVKFWEEPLRRFGHLLTPGTLVAISGKKDEWKGFISLVAEDVAELSSVVEELAA